MAQAFLQDRLVQFEFRDDLLQLRVLFLQAKKFRKLRPPHPVEPLSSVAISHLADPHAGTCRLQITAARKLHLNLARQLQYIRARITCQNHNIYFQYINYPITRGKRTQRYKGTPRYAVLNAGWFRAQTTINPFSGNPTTPQSRLEHATASLERRNEEWHHIQDIFIHDNF